MTLLFTLKEFFSVHSHKKKAGHSDRQTNRQADRPVLQLMLPFTLFSIKRMKNRKPGGKQESHFLKWHVFADDIKSWLKFRLLPLCFHVIRMDDRKDIFFKGVFLVCFSRVDSAGYKLMHPHFFSCVFCCCCFFVCFFYDATVFKVDNCNYADRGRRCESVV